MVEKIIFSLLLILNLFIVYPHDNIGIKIFGFTIHPLGEERNAHLMPLKLDKNAYFVINLGALVHYEKKLHKDIFTLKLVQALYSDCAARLGGFSHIGFRGRICKINNFSIWAGCGPTLVFRRNWMKLEGYYNPNFFKGDVDDMWQYKFILYAGEIELKYKINKVYEFVFTIIPGFPHIINFSAGMNIFIKNS
ncbi:MAG: hypothetical protein N3A01_03715 [Bacteroidales bacterium]|nr:hypothetical protein [Bacteroidales bacterium]